MSSRKPGAKSVLAVAWCIALAASCSGDDEPRGLDELTTPTYAPADDEASGDGDDDAATGVPPSTTTAAPAEAQDPASADGTAGTGDGAPSVPEPPVERVRFDDPVGDATPGVGAGVPPGWSDLAGGMLERKGDAYGLTIRLGDTAPERAPGSETMNIASFYDVDGDGAVEYEIWINLGPDGWGPVWYDDQGNAAPGEDSNVAVEVDGDAVRLLFPAVMLGSPDRLRFSVASEYGELSVIGSSFARRDDAPDGDRAVSFPG